MAAAAHREAAGTEVDDDRREGGEDLLGVSLADQYLLDGAEHRLIRYAGERQRPPRHAQLHAERRLLDAVPADVADEQGQAPRRGLDRVVEIPAQQRAAPAGPVQRGE